MSFGAPPLDPVNDQPPTGPRFRQAERLARQTYNQLKPRLRQSARTIYALILREASTRYGRRTAGYAWAVLMPMAQLAVLMAIFSAMGRGAPAGGSLIVFFMTGLIPLFLWRNGLTRGANAIRANLNLMNYPQVRPFEILTARMLLEIVTTIAVALIIVAIMATFANLPLTSWVDEPLKLLQALGSLALFSYGTLVFSAQLGRLFEPWADLSTFIGRAAWFVSGVWFTFGSLPAGPRQYALYNPIAHQIEWIRDAAIPGFDSNLYDPAFPLWCGLGLLFTGLLIEWLISLSGFSDRR